MLSTKTSGNPWIVVVCCDHRIRSEFEKAVESGIKLREKLISGAKLVSQAIQSDSPENQHVQIEAQKGAISFDTIIELMIKKIIDIKENRDEPEQIEVDEKAKGKGLDKKDKKGLKKDDKIQQKKEDKLQLKKEDKTQLKKDEKSPVKKDDKPQLKKDDKQSGKREERSNSAIGKQKSTKNKANKDALQDQKDQNMEKQYSMDPDDAPDIPQYPQKFLLITGIPDDLSALLQFHTKLQEYDLRVNAIINIRSVPFIPDSFMKLLLRSQTKLLFPSPQMLGIKQQEIGLSNQIVEKEKQSKVKDQQKQQQVSVVKKKDKDKDKEKKDFIFEEGLESLGPNFSYQLSNAGITAMQDVIQQQQILYQRILNNDNQQNSFEPPPDLEVFNELEQTDISRTHLSLFDQVCLVRRILIDGPTAILRGIITIEILGGVPFHLNIHAQLPPDQTQVNLSTIIQNQSQQQPSIQQSPMVSPKGDPKQSKKQQTQLRSGSSHGSTTEQKQDIIELPDAFALISQSAPKIPDLPKPTLIPLTYSKAQESSPLKTIQKEILFLNPPPLYPSTYPGQSPYSTLSPYSPDNHEPSQYTLASVSSNSFHNIEQIAIQFQGLTSTLPDSPYSLQKITPNQPVLWSIPQNNFFIPPPILYIPKDGITILREIHLSIAQIAARQSLYQLWIEGASVESNTINNKQENEQNDQINNLDNYLRSSFDQQQILSKEQRQSLIQQSRINRVT